MSLQVVIESAGDHVFDLPLLRRQKAGDLVALWLRRARYNDGLWRVRVEKKITCTSQTRPATAVSPKPWCCYVKIKPGDNNTGHLCALLVPHGLRGEDVFAALKQAEDLVDRRWRDQQVSAMNDEPRDDQAAVREDAAALEEESEEQAAPEAAGVEEFSGWTKDPERLQLTLLAIDEVGRAGSSPSKEQFVESLMERMGWRGVNRYQIGGVFTSLVRRGYILNIRQGCRSLGYQLSDEGRRLIRDLLPSSPAEPTPAGTTFTTDLPAMLEALTGLAQDYAGAWAKLQENRAKRTALLSEVEKLDAEARRLEQTVGNPEVQALLQRLAQIARKPS